MTNTSTASTIAGTVETKMKRVATAKPRMLNQSGRPARIVPRPTGSRGGASSTTTSATAFTAFAPRTVIHRFQAIMPKWVSGVTQGLMWRATNPDGTLVYRARRHQDGGEERRHPPRETEHHDAGVVDHRRDQE